LFFKVLKISTSSNIFSDLEKLTDETFDFNLTYFKDFGWTPRYSANYNLSSEFREKIKKETIEYLQDRLKQIDKQLEEL
jgi:hypothetical protein